MFVRAILEEGDTGRWWHVSTPIHIGEEVIGAISVRVSLKEADLLAREQRKQASLIALITICVLVISLMFFFRRTILRPISSLIGAMKEAESGNLAQEVSVNNRDELGIMAENFNRMLKRIRESTEENLKLLETINGFNEDLKGKVAQATQELAGRNEELIRANELLFELQRKLSHSEKLAAVGQVSAAMAHEIGTPLNSIFGHLQLITEEAELNAEAKKE
jgi:methyl-accepting chemotaxis protein